MLLENGWIMKMKVNEAGTQMKKQVLDTEAQQKLLRNIMQGEVQMAKKDLAREVKSVVEQVKNDSKKDFDASKEK